MSEYLYAALTVTLLLATAAVGLATTRVMVNAWRGREEDAQHLATLLLSREATRQEESERDDTSGGPPLT
jgi:branched-subunit amino acid ABC-type transport system permease component